ncbi:hypothetical protein SOVF_000940 [Spinacia oleracea]|nr:hypothetical protein SOVF_000940 [Spinacia oleracea]
MEAVGEVVAVGPGLTGRKVGDLVAYAGNPMGSYSEFIDQQQLRKSIWK